MGGVSGAWLAKRMWTRDGRGADRGRLVVPAAMHEGERGHAEGVEDRGTRRARVELHGSPSRACKPIGHTRPTSKTARAHDPVPDAAPSRRRVVARFLVDLAGARARAPACCPPHSRALRPPPCCAAKSASESARNQRTSGGAWTRTDEPRPSPLPPCGWMPAANVGWVAGMVHGRRRGLGAGTAAGDASEPRRRRSRAARGGWPDLPLSCMLHE
eukprot:363195-Chlamydomonas_euryale.AAC.3